MNDLSDLSCLKKYLRKNGISPQKQLGQHFLVDDIALQDIVAAAELQKTDSLLEIGPGPGVLSRRLAPLVHDLVAVEIDPDMISPWKEMMKDYSNSSLVQQDVLQYSAPDHPYKLVANIPYYISSPILKHFLRLQRGRRPDIIVLLIQKEVAQRVCTLSKPTLLSWELRIFGDPSIVAVVPRSSFYPAPKVDSAILKIQVHDTPLLAEELIEEFFEFLFLAYTHARKTLSNNLSSHHLMSKENLSDLFSRAGLDARLRPHQLDFDQWKALFSVWKDF